MRLISYMAGFLLLCLAVPGVVGQDENAPVTYGQFSTWLGDFQATYDQDLKNIRADQAAAQDVARAVQNCTPKSGVSVEADAESVVNGVVGNTSDRVSVKATGGAVVSVVVGQGGTAQKSEQDSSATTNNDVLPSVHQDRAGQGSNPYDLQGQSMEGYQEMTSYNPSKSGAYAGAGAGVVFSPNINVSATNFQPGQVVPVIDATKENFDNGAPAEFWSGLGVQITTLQHPQSVEILSRRSLGMVSYPISSDVKENVAYDQVFMSDGGSQIGLPTSDGNIAVFSPNGWVIFNDPAAALSALSTGRSVVRIERHR